MVQQENKTLFLFVGKSASGKTTVDNMLEADGYDQISSYTTRPPRYEGEIGHTFISDEEYDKLKNIMAFTLYNGYRYCTTLEQVQEADIYVVDPAGVQTLIDNYDLLQRKLCIIYFSANVYNRIERMLSRHDSDTAIVGRLLQDEKTDWGNSLLDMIEDDGSCIEFRVVDANQDLNEVYFDVKKLIQERTR